jgi:hypothetical protein
MLRSSSAAYVRFALITCPHTPLMSTQSSSLAQVYSRAGAGGRRIGRGSATGAVEGTVVGGVVLGGGDTGVGSGGGAPHAIDTIDTSHIDERATHDSVHDACVDTGTHVSDAFVVRALHRVMLVALTACSSPATTADAGMTPFDGAIPVARCTAPTRADVSHPTQTVGTGTAASCTEAALRAAATAGGVIVFDCGAAPVTITVTSQISFANETVIDGGGTVTLSGGGSSRIFYLASDYNTHTPRLTVQRLTFRDGHSTRMTTDTDGGGAAIYRNGGSLTVIDSVFEGNHAPMTGQDLAGGAIYGFGGGDTIISGCTFTNNSASDGGAVGSLNAALTVINSTFTGNAATGNGGNPGNGGCGGALYQDGRSEMTTICGATIQNNTAGAVGGGVFRVSNDHTGSFAMDRTTVDANTVMDATGGNAGGLYLEGLALNITASTISRNQGAFCGGIWINTCTVMMVNDTIAENTATASNGGGMWLGHTPTGTMLNCTIANNHATAMGNVAGAIFGDGLTLTNTLVANNTAQYRPTCDVMHTSGGGNLQWPSGGTTTSCTMSPVVMDPMLGALADHGGATQVMVPGAAAHGIGIGCPPTDQLGMPRATACTAGAVE